MKNKVRTKLRDLRIRQGYTHQEVAEGVGISRVAYTNIERGNKGPSFKVARMIKKFFGVESDEIFLPYDVSEKQHEENNVLTGTKN